MGKNRIAPKKQISIPRLEMCGAVLGARLRRWIEKEVDYKFSKIIHLIDSEIVRVQIQKESYGFQTFVATRIGEIQEKTEPSEWWRILDVNPADLTTRPLSPNNLKMNNVVARIFKQANRRMANI